MTNVKLTAEQLGTKFDGEVIVTEGKQQAANGGEVFINLGEQTNEFGGTEVIWASEALIASHNEALQPEVAFETASEDGEPDMFAAAPTVGSVDVTLQTIGTRLESQDETLTPTAVSTYLAQGALTVAATGQAIRSFQNLVDLTSNSEEKPVILFVRNKTGN